MNDQYGRKKTVPHWEQLSSWETDRQPYDVGYVP